MKKEVFERNSVFKRLGLCQIALLVAVSLAFAVAPSNSYATADNQVIIQLQAGQTLSSINQSYGTSTAQQLDGSNTYLLNPAAGQTADNLVTQQGKSEFNNL